MKGFFNFNGFQKKKKTKKDITKKAFFWIRRPYIRKLYNTLLILWLSLQTFLTFLCVLYFPFFQPKKVMISPSMNAFFFFHRKTMTSRATMMMMIAVADDIRTKCNSIWTAAAEQKRHFLLPFILVFLVLVNFCYVV